jgi:hypothetical protein
LSDFVAREVERGGVLEAVPLREVLHAQGALFDRLIAAVTEAYTDEATDRHKTTECRRAEQVKLLLDGELVEGDELAYPLAAWHLGVIAICPGAPEAIRDLAAALECRLLLCGPTAA